jgi:DNA-binding transcriptional MerR regulator
VTDLWTLPELVSEVAARIAALPPPRNGQVRAIPDERTIRYYATIGLLDRPASMRGRTALYARRHVAQVVAIKRLQTMGRSLSEIQDLWPTLDARTLSRMSGVALDAAATAPARTDFWKREPRPREPSAPAAAHAPAPPAPRAPAHDAVSGTSNAMDEPPTDPEPDHATRDALEPSPAPPGEPSPAPRGEPSPAPRSEPWSASSPRAPLELRLELAPHVVLSLSVVDESVAISPADVRALRAAAAPLLAELAARRLAPHPGGEDP